MVPLLCFLQAQLRMATSILDSLVPLLTLFTNQSEWKMKMIASLKRQDLYEVSIGLGKESYEDENDWLNDGEYSKDLQKKIGKILWKSQ